MSIRDQLRKLKVFPEHLPPANFADVPDHPIELFLTWLRDAIERGVSEPHAMTLSTISTDGTPDSRVLILKDVLNGELYFATSSGSRKGLELAECASVALSFYWKEVGRQVRVLGLASPADRKSSGEDFLARPIGSRVEALLSRQSQRLESRAELDEEAELARLRLEADPELIARNWTLYGVRAHEVEFWQADRERKHHRLRYSRVAREWSRSLLWP